MLALIIVSAPLHSCVCPAITHLLKLAEFDRVVKRCAIYLQAVVFKLWVVTHQIQINNTVLSLYVKHCFSKMNLDQFVHPDVTVRTIIIIINSSWLR